MTLLRRLASSSPLAVGIVIVFAGISAALGFSIGGMIAAVALIAALLFAGGVRFGGAPAIPNFADAAATIIVFDRALRVVAGATSGTPLLSQFPEPLRPEIGERCRAALRGEHTHFLCEHAGRRLSFDVAPVPMSDGAVMYGVLICGRGVRVAAVGAAPLTTVA
jgi:hypothetical protein